MKIVIPERKRIQDNINILHIFTDNYYSDDVVLQMFLDIKNQIERPLIFEYVKGYWAQEFFFIKPQLKPIFTEYKSNTFVSSNDFALTMLFLNYKQEKMLKRREKKSRKLKS